MRVLGRSRAVLLQSNMAFIARPGFSTNTEVEASSFSVWNCVITFLQILLVSTVLYGAGWNFGQAYNVTPDNLVQYHNLRTIAFFFCAWALQSVALALLLVWGIGKRSYHLCHSWMLCETLMQLFIILTVVYFTYRSYFEGKSPSHSGFQHFISNSNGDYDYFSVNATNSNTVSSTQLHHNHHDTLRPPRHFIFLVILHFLIKGFGFWIVRRYMNLLKTTGVQSRGSDNDEAGNANESANRSGRQQSPPPAYSHLCKDEPPCYDEALKLCLKDSAIDMDTNNSEPKNTVVPV